MVPAQRTVNKIRVRISGKQYCFFDNVIDLTGQSGSGTIDSLSSCAGRLGMVRFMSPPEYYSFQCDMPEDNHSKALGLSSISGDREKTVVEKSSSLSALIRTMNQFTCYSWAVISPVNTT